MTMAKTTCVFSNAMFTENSIEQSISYNDIDHESGIVDCMNSVVKSVSVVCSELAI